MAALDTNVLVRYLVADNAKQYKAARDLIDGAESDEVHFIPVSVIIELEWVLRSQYNQGKVKILDLFNKLLESRELEFQEDASIEIALSLYADNNVDFVDCLHIGTAFSRKKTPLMSFDRKASRLAGTMLVNR